MIHRRSKKPSIWKKALIISAITVGSLIIFGGVIAATTKPEDAKRYEYAYLGDKCYQAAANYDKINKDIEAESSQITAQTDQNNRASQNQVASTDAANREMISRVAADYKQLYDQGSISSQEYADRLNRLNSAGIGILAGSETASIQARIQNLQDTVSKLEKNSAAIKTINANIAKLNSCIDSANRQQNFTASELADIEALFTSSISRPQ